jgi:hypothetical protein
MFDCVKISTRLGWPMAKYVGVKCSIPDTPRARQFGQQKYPHGSQDRWVF